MSIEEFKVNTVMKCSGSQKFPNEILLRYRSGNYPETVVNAFCVGKCTLEVQVGDCEQPPVSLLGRPIRQYMYGLATPLVRRDIRNCVTEYYRSEKSMKSGEKPWEYAPHKVEPQFGSRLDLLADQIF